MNKKETMTMRQYAKRCGTSHQTVSTAIRNDKIIEGYDIITGRIVPDVADMEWGLEFMQKNIMKKMTSEEKELIDSVEDWDPFQQDDEIKQNTTAKELTRLELLYKARMGKIKVEEAVKKLVSRDEMYKEMFEFGKEIRMSIQAIPDRIIDQLLVLDRNAAHKLLSESINESLEKLNENENSN